MKQFWKGMIAFWVIVLCGVPLCEAQTSQYVKQNSAIMFAVNGSALLASGPTAAMADTIAILPNGDGGSVLRVSEDGASLFVGSWSGAVYQYTYTSNTALFVGSQQLLQSNPYGANITGLAYDARGKKLYACGQNKVFKIDVSSTQWKTTLLADLKGPAQIITTFLMLGENGLYVGNTTSAQQAGSQVNLISTSTPQKILKTVGLDGTQSIVLCQNGNVLVAGNTKLYLLSKNLQRLSSVALPGGTPNGLAVSDDGTTAYAGTFQQDISGYNWGRFIRFSVTANAVSLIDSISIGSRIPVGISVWPKKNMAYAGMAPPSMLDPRNNVIKIINMTGPAMAVTDSILVTSSPTFSQALLSIPSLLATTVDVGSQVSGIGINTATNTIYVTSGSGSRVVVVNGATDRRDTSVQQKVAGMPIGVAVDTATNKIYVANQWGNNVNVINGATKTVVDTVPTGQSPMYVAVNSSTNKIYVVNFHGQSLTVINGSTLSVDTTMSMGWYSNGVAVNSATNKIYWVDLTNTSVKVIDGSTYSVDTSINILTSPLSIAVNAVTNKIYVGQYNRTDGLGGYWRPNQPRYSVTVIDGATNTIDTALIVDAEPMCVAVNPLTNTIYVGNNNNLTVIDGATNRMRILHLPPLVVPMKIAVNPKTSKVYVLDTSGNSIIAIQE